MKRFLIVTLLLSVVCLLPAQEKALAMRNKEGAEAIIDSYLTHMKPKAFELVFDNDGPEVRRLIKKVRESGAKIFINSLWPELCGGHDDDRAVELRQPDESWGWIIGQGAKLIQTDRPALLLEYLKAKNRHE